MQTTTVLAPSSTHAVQADLAGALAAELAGSLAALRVTLESLAAELAPGDPLRSRLQRGIGSTVAATRWLEALLESARPSEPRPLVCTLDEIARSVAQAARIPGGARLSVAIEDPARTLLVDGPRLVRALVRLVECRMADGSTHALLRVEQRGSEARFAVLAGCQRETETVWPLPAIERQLVQHEVERLGGSFDECGALRCELRFRSLERPEAGR